MSRTAAVSPVSNNLFRPTVLARKIRSLGFLMRAATGRGALPNALIAGVSKGGTTSLFSYLVQHPRVSGSRTKEVQFFDNQFDKGLNWYRANFSPARESVILEASPYYLYHPLAPVRAASVVPDAKLIFLLRNPVDRAYSHYKQNVDAGFELLEFEEALACEHERVRGTEEALIRGRLTRSREHQIFSYCGAGHYAKHLRRWLAHFPRDQMLIMRSETFFAAPQAGVDAVCDFLGLNRFHVTDLDAKNQRFYTPVSGEVRLRLHETFVDVNIELKNLGGISW